MAQGPKRETIREKNMYGDGQLTFDYLLFEIIGSGLHDKTTLPFRYENEK